MVSYSRRRGVTYGEVARTHFVFSVFEFLIYDVPRNWPIGIRQNQAQQQELRSAVCVRIAYWPIPIASSCFGDRSYGSTLAYAE